MSEDEKRALRAQVLLEAEEAKEELALLHVKAAQWGRLFESVAALLKACAREDNTVLFGEMRQRVEKLLDAHKDVWNPAAVFGLVDGIRVAAERVKQAQAAKAELGFK